jgi:hypothetical protein
VVLFGAERRMEASLLILKREIEPTRGTRRRGRGRRSGAVSHGLAGDPEIVTVSLTDRQREATEEKERKCR